jgi:lysophospholipase L1-like esterase/RNA-binding protein YhbY
LAIATGVVTTYVFAEMVYVILRTPRLPPAAGARKKDKGDKSVKLYCIGDSVAAGCGLKGHDVAMAGIHATAVEDQLDVEVSYEVYGKIGYTTRQIEKLCVSRIPRSVSERPDIIVISTGVNNIIEAQSTGSFRLELSSLLDTVDSITDSHSLVILLGIPPMSMFTALPPLLQFVFGWRARQYDDVMRSVSAGRARVAHNSFVNLTVPEDYGLDLLASDGFHPGTGGLRWVADRAKPYFKSWGGPGSRVEMGVGIDDSMSLSTVPPRQQVDESGSSTDAPSAQQRVRKKKGIVTMASFAGIFRLLSLLVLMHAGDALLVQKWSPFPMQQSLSITINRMAYPSVNGRLTHSWLSGSASAGEEGEVEMKGRGRRALRAIAARMVQEGAMDPDSNSIDRLEIINCKIDNFKNGQFRTNLVATLQARELVKLRVLGEGVKKKDVKEAGMLLVEEIPNSELVQVVGHTALIYQPNNKRVSELLQKELAK